MDRIIVNTTLTAEDWRAYCVVAAQRAYGGSSAGAMRYLRWLPTGLFLGLGALVLMAPAIGFPRYLALGALGGVLALHWIGQLFSRLGVAPLDDGIFIGAAELTFSAEGIRVQRADYQSFARWKQSTEVTVAAGHVFVWIDRMTAHVLPVRDLAPRDPEEIARAIREMIAAAVSAAPAAADLTTALQATPAVPQPHVVEAIKASSPVRRLFEESWRS